MTKTPEELANEYAKIMASDIQNRRTMRTEKDMSNSKVIDLLSYKHAKKANASHTYDALMYNLFIKQPQKKTTKIDWTSVADRLPRGDTKGWFVVLLEMVGSLRTIGSSQFINGEWLQIREGLVHVTHWAEMPKELP